MNKNIILAISVLLGISALAFVLSFVFPPENISDADKKSQNLNIVWEECGEYIDFTKNLSVEDQEKILKTFRKTDDTTILKKYSCSKNIAWRAYIAENINTPEKILSFYTDDSSYIVRQYLSANRALPENLAQKLQNDEERVLFALARNPVVSSEILAKIAQENFSPNIQESLGYNRGTTEEFQKHLAEKITSINALKQLKNNPNIFESVKKILEEREAK